MIVFQSLLGCRVSIHAPREGCDSLVRFIGAVNLSVSIHAPREGCDLVGQLNIPHESAVSIHAPREGCDSDGGVANNWSWEFQFTHPGRGATCTGLSDAYSLCRFNSRTPGGVRLGGGLSSASKCSTVSIHAPREGCDLLLGYLGLTPPEFQFTHPGRGATPARDGLFSLDHVSIHAPREGCDNTCRVSG